MPFTVHRAADGELSQIAVLEAACFSFPGTVDQIRREAGDGLHLFLTAVEEGQDTVLGYVGLTHILDEGYIGNVAVSPPYRREGVATALLRALDREAEALSLSFVTLEVRRSNLPAIALYEKNGYAHTGTMKNHYSKPQEDALIMTKRFVPSGGV